MNQADKLCGASIIIAIVMIAGGITWIVYPATITQIERMQDNTNLFGVEVEVPFGVTYSYRTDILDTIYIYSTDYGYALNMTLTINGSIPFTVKDDQNIMILNSTSKEVNGYWITTLELTVYMEKLQQLFFSNSGKKTINLIPLEA